MRRLTRRQASQDAFGQVLLTVLDCLGLDIDELPDIIPDDPDQQQYLVDWLKAKGIDPDTPIDALQPNPPTETR